MLAEAPLENRTISRQQPAPGPRGTPLRTARGCSRRTHGSTAAVVTPPTVPTCRWSADPRSLRWRQAAQCLGYGAAYSGMPEHPTAAVRLLSAHTAIVDVASPSTHRVRLPSGGSKAAPPSVWCSPGAGKAPWIADMVVFLSTCLRTTMRRWRRPWQRTLLVERYAYEWHFHIST